MHLNCTSGLCDSNHGLSRNRFFFHPDFVPIRKETERTWEGEASRNLSATPSANHSSGLSVGVTHKCHPLIAIMWCFWLYSVHPHYCVVFFGFFWLFLWTVAASLSDSEREEAKSYGYKYENSVSRCAYMPHYCIII